MPAMAPAAPHPRSSFTPRALTWKNRPTLEPIALPVEAMGASSPTLPPNATVRVEATNDEYMLRGGRAPFFRDMEKSTLGIPWPISPFITYFTKSTVSRIPTSGAKRISTLPPPVAKWASPTFITYWPDQCTTVFSNTAAKPLKTPTITLRSSKYVCSGMWCNRQMYSLLYASLKRISKILSRGKDTKSFLFALLLETIINKYINNRHSI